MTSQGIPATDKSAVRGIVIDSQTLPSNLRSMRHVCDEEWRGAGTQWLVCEGVSVFAQKNLQAEVLRELFQSSQFAKTYRAERRRNPDSDISIPVVVGCGIGSSSVSFGRPHDWKDGLAAQVLDGKHEVYSILFRQGKAENGLQTKRLNWNGGCLCSAFQEEPIDRGVEDCEKQCGSTGKDRVRTSLEDTTALPADRAAQQRPTHSTTNSLNTLRISQTQGEKEELFSTPSKIGQSYSCRGKGVSLPSADHAKGASGIRRLKRYRGLWAPPLWDCGVFSTQNADVRPTMEDEHVIIFDLARETMNVGENIIDAAETPSTASYCSDRKKCAFLAVFDGHGGREVVEVLKERLHCDLTKSQYFPTDVCSALVEAYVALDKSILKMGRTNKWTSGSTALSVVVEGEVVYLANTGDSAAVLCRAGKAHPLTVNHRPDHPAELLRIEKAGGRVINGYVSNLLGVSRSFGDLDERTSEKIAGVIAVPDVHKQRLDDQDEFLIMACDGLWDVFVNAQDAVNIVCTCLSRGDGADSACEALGEEALRRNCCDNLTVILLIFTPGRRISHRTETPAFAEVSHRCADDSDGHIGVVVDEGIVESGISALKSTRRCSATSAEVGRREIDNRRRRRASPPPPRSSLMPRSAASGHHFGDARGFYRGRHARRSRLGSDYGLEELMQTRRRRLNLTSLNTLQQALREAQE